MRFLPLFPTCILIDNVEEISKKMLPLCNKYTQKTQTNLLGQANFPSTLYDELSIDVNKEPLVIETLEYIHSRYIKKILYDRGVFYDRNKFGDPYGFFSDMKKGAQLRKHSHQDCQFSGIIYLEVGDNVPELIFHDPRPYPKFQTSDFKTNDAIPIKPENNLILIWDHWLDHEVREKTSDQPRKAFSFNI